MTRNEDTLSRKAVHERKALLTEVADRNFLHSFNCTSVVYCYSEQICLPKVMIYTTIDA